MPLWKVDIQKNYYGDYITNVYHVVTPDITSAMQAANDIAQLERKLLFPDQFIDNLRVSTPAPADEVFYTLPVNIPGTRPTAGQLLPAFCRIRVDLSVGYRRPGRKFLLSLTETDQASGQLEPAMIAFVNANYAVPLVALGVCASPDGSMVISAACKASVGMRQLKRASKRKIPTI